MKPLALTMVILIGLFGASHLSAQKLYTWTDENGVTHITDQPPPKRAKLQNVITYTEETPEETEAIQRRKKELRKELDQEEKIEKAQQAEIRARKAEEEANQAMKKTEQEIAEKQEYIRRLSSTRDKRKQFRKRIERLKKEAEAAQANAQSAVQKAQEAAAEATAAAEEARKAQ